MPNKRFDVDGPFFLPESLFTAGFCQTVSAPRANLIIVHSKHAYYHFVFIYEFELFLPSKNEHRL